MVVNCRPRSNRPFTSGGLDGGSGSVTGPRSRGAACWRCSRQLLSHHSTHEPLRASDKGLVPVVVLLDLDAAGAVDDRGILRQSAEPLAADELSSSYSGSVHSVVSLDQPVKTLGPNGSECVQ